jgi:hypothetical protein
MIKVKFEVFKEIVGFYYHVLSVVLGVPLPTRHSSHALKHVKLSVGVLRTSGNPVTNSSDDSQSSEEQKKSPLIKGVVPT